MAETVLLFGATDAGTQVKVLEDNDKPGYGNRFRVWIDGQEYTVSHARRMRDGGTTFIDLVDGRQVVRVSPMRDGFGRLDNHELKPFPESEPEPELSRTETQLQRAIAIFQELSSWVRDRRVAGWAGTAGTPLLLVSVCQAATARSGNASVRTWVRVEVGPGGSDDVFGEVVAWLRREYGDEVQWRPVGERAIEI